MTDEKQYDVLFVASMGNHVWAFDVEGNGAWQTSELGTPYNPPLTNRSGRRSPSKPVLSTNKVLPLRSSPIKSNARLYS
jgi:hypothetical protein